ncbi:hypothetical protein [Clavibacter nebraskensis]|uniref:hypothetical protein n=1 Tax=Clavibacter nebraskensis TaxID=31963 RepID=UPI00200E8B73|nr:hypothetical protein [Clavibacter nebraskensis]UQB14597.1 hypothetical protein LIX20_001219 [Clavibacter nebraskensis]UQB17429.1 hypothetical protein LIX22_001218 [Clavibacter nebraskensis]
MTVSVEAASLLAQVLPVGILLLVLESRRAIEFYESKGWAGAAVKAMYWVYFAAATLTGLSATRNAVTAVILDEPVRGAAAHALVNSSYFLYLAVFAFAALIALSESGLSQVLYNLGERTRARTAARRAARQGRHEAEDR